jgi:mRNA-degrading endonuclease YafQ of YafQ-DinJ toxin-antitoxin module
MPKYQVKFTKRMDHHLRMIRERFGLLDSQANEVVEEIFYLEELFEHGEDIPEAYRQHELVREPWNGFLELHVLDDVLLVHIIDDKRGLVRFIGLYNHEMLSTGQLD